MNRLNKFIQEEFNKKVKKMSEEEKSNYDFILQTKGNYNTLVELLHRRLFQEEYDFMGDDFVDAKRRDKGENPMSQEYIQKMNEKRVKLGFLPLSNNGYDQDGDKTKEYCRKLIIGEIEYKSIN